MHLRAYKIRWLGWFEYIAFGGLCGALVFGIATTLFDVSPWQEPPGRRMALALMSTSLIFVFWLFYLHLRIPIEICVTDNGEILLRSPVRTLKLLASQIEKVEYLGEGDWTLHHLQGKQRLMGGKWQGMDKFLKWLVQANPNAHIVNKTRGM